MQRGFGVGIKLLQFLQDLFRIHAAIIAQAAGGGKKGGPMRKNLQSARKAAGLTQQAMADKLGISERYYRFIEAGTRDGAFACAIINK